MKVVVCKEFVTVCQKLRTVDVEPPFDVIIEDVQTRKQRTERE